MKSGSNQYRTLKSKLLIAFLSLFSLALSAQEKGTISLQPILEYGYNYTYLNYGCIGAVADFRLADNFSLNGGLQANSANLYSVMAKGTVDIPLKKGKLFIENRYLYKAFVRNNMQELNAGISLGYRAKYWKIQGGYYSKFFTQLNKKNSDIYSVIVEPFGILYLLEAQVFKPKHVWNIGGRVSNFDHFIIERFGNPIFTVFGNYSMNETLRFFAETGVRPSGITNINANFWGFFLQFGMVLSW